MGAVEPRCGADSRVKIVFGEFDESSRQGVDMSSCKMRPRACGCEFFCGSCVTGGENCVRERAEKGYCVLAVLFVTDDFWQVHVRKDELRVHDKLCCRWM